MLVGEMYKIKIITILVLAVSLIQVSTQQQNTEDENNQQENNESDEKVREETLAAARRGDIIGFRKGINKGGLKSYVNLYKNYSEQKMKHIENSMNNKMHAIERLIASKLAVPASKNQSEQYHFNVTILPGTDIITQLSLNLEALKNWEYYESPLHNICNLPDVEPRIVKYLLDKDLNTNERSDMNETPLDLAAYNGNLALVKLLIEKGADPKSTVQIDNDHYERMNYHRFIEVISSKDLRVHNGSKIHFSPLVSAIPDGHIDVVKYLISLGADVNVGNQSLTALRSPVIDGNADMVELLLKSGCDVNGKDVMGATALHMAADKGHLKIAKLLLDNGAKITATDNFGWTPLHVAAFSSYNITLLELLLESGASINVKTNGGFTPLILAEAGSNLSFLSCLAPTIASNFTNHTSCQQKSTKSTQSILDLLCKRGANSQQRDETLGWTTLHWASAIGDEKAAKFLVDKCAASVEVRSKAGHSPSDVAKYFGRSTL